MTENTRIIAICSRLEATGDVISYLEVYSVHIYQVANFELAARVVSKKNTNSIICDDIEGDSGGQR